VTIIEPKVGPTSTPENLKDRIVGLMFKNTLKGCCEGNNFTRNSIYTCGSKESFIPKFKGRRSTGKERQANFNNVSMFPLDNSILLMCMPVGNKMSYADFFKEGMRFLILSTPISLYRNNFSVKESFNKILEQMKSLKHIRFELEKINPSEFTIIINEVDIIFISSNETRCRTPNIRKMSSKG
jgi:hypothetical protein